MKIAVIIVRWLLGLIFLFFGFNAFFHYLPTPPIPGDAGVILGVMMSHGWVTFYSALYVIAGVLLLIGRFVPVALVILGPILVNILLFHITLAPAGIGPGLLATLLELFLIWVYWPAFAGVFSDAKRF